MEDYDEQNDSLADSAIVGKYHSAADVVNSKKFF
jgi:hypothetical protein